MGDGCTEMKQLDIDAFETGKSFRAIERSSAQRCFPEPPKKQDLVISDTLHVGSPCPG